MVAGVTGARAILGDDLPEAARLALLVIVAVPLYLVALRVVGRGVYEELLDYVRSTLSRRATHIVPADAA